MRLQHDTPPGGGIRSGHIVLLEPGQDDDARLLCEAVMVKDPAGAEVSAEVEGSDIDPYEVTVRLHDSGVAEARCSCMREPSRRRAYQKLPRVF